MTNRFCISGHTTLSLVVTGLISLLQGQVSTAEPVPLKLLRPVPHQVVQRTGIAPGTGYARVDIDAAIPIETAGAIWEYRISAAGATDNGAWLPLSGTTANNQLQATARIPAGGWYRLDIRAREDDSTIAEGTVEPVGVGEIFIVAGQSYAANSNDEQLRVTDPQSRVVAFDSAGSNWVVADDPQPIPDGSDGGSIWPPLGDSLAREFQVPVAFANVAWGGTSSEQWLPGGALHPRLVATGRWLGRFRAVLWQQGESDVIAKTPAETYVSNVQTIRSTAVQAWGFDPPWLLAKSTLHPTVYNDPEGEARIRGAIDSLTKQSGFVPGPDTDTLTDANRGDSKSRRHFTGAGQRNAAAMWLTSIRQQMLPATEQDALLVGVAEEDITPPMGFPMAGYYHERLAEGELDPLKAKAIVFRTEQTSAALVVCDLIGIATDLRNQIRERASEKTGIPASHIAVSATHTHTAPDYMKELFLRLGNEPQESLRAEYIDRLIEGPVDAICVANLQVGPVLIETGAATQQEPVSFNRRAVTRDGSVKTWMAADHPDFIRTAGPVDSQIGLVMIRDERGTPLGLLSNFALHLDTVGGSKWSADYPFFIERALQHSLETGLISIFGTGCCGDINHVNPRRQDRNKADFIGQSIADSIVRDLSALKLLENQTLVVKSRTVHLPLQDATEDEVTHSLEILDRAKRKESVDFFEHVTAYKMLILDQLRHKTPFAKTVDHITWGLSRSLAGIGESLPVDLTVITIGRDVAIVALPGEAFVELGLAIKQASPFRTTLVIELANGVETIYVPTRAAYAGGSYEVTNSATMPGSGEMLVQAAIELLREAATESTAWPASSP